MSVLRPQADVLTKLLDVASVRHQVIAQNVANVNTPLYRQIDVAFEDVFARRLSRGDQAAALKVKPLLVYGLGGAERADGNNVDIDGEMNRLTKNGLLFRTFAQLLAVELGALRTAISGQVQ